MKFSRITALVLTVVMIMPLFGCNQAASPRDAVDRFAAAMNQNNFRSAFAYVADYDNFGFSGGSEEIMKAVASSLKIEFLSEDVGSSTATVDVNVTTIDLREIYMDAAAEVIPNYYGDAVSGKHISESEIGRKLVDSVVEQANRSYAPTVTTRLSLYLVNDSGKWRIKLDTNAYYAITGYLDDANNLVTTGLIVSAIETTSTQPTAAPQPTQPVSQSDTSAEVPADGASADGASAETATTTAAAAEAGEG